MQCSVSDCNWYMRTRARKSRARVNSGIAPISAMVPAEFVAQEEDELMNAGFNSESIEVFHVVGGYVIMVEIVRGCNQLVSRTVRK